jgi:hypothetical protein
MVSTYGSPKSQLLSNTALVEHSIRGAAIESSGQQGIAVE